MLFRYKVSSISLLTIYIQFLYLLKHYCEKGLVGPDVVVVSPKNSGVKRARSLAEYLDAPIAIIDYAQDDSERNQGYIIGEVEGKKAILIDDILNFRSYILRSS